jgi:hypothetical protein
MGKMSWRMAKSKPACGSPQEQEVSPMLAYIIRLPRVKSQAPALDAPRTQYLWQLLLTSTSAVCRPGRSALLTGDGHASHARP